MSDDLVIVAQIAGAFGVKGEVRIRPFTQRPEDCLAYGPLKDEAGAIVVTPVSWRPHKDVYVVRPEERLEREAWDALKGVDLYAPRAAFPEPDPDEFYIDDLVDCAVRHSDGRDLGVVKAAQNFGAGDLLDIEPPGGGQSYYLPFSEAVVMEVDLEDRQIIADADDAYLPDDLKTGGD